MSKPKKKKPRPVVTPRAQIKNAVRQLWLRSCERAAAMKRDGYCCVDCGVKQSTAKGREVEVEVDHLDGIDWDKVVDYMRRHVLVPHDRLETVCKPDHKKRGDSRREINGGSNGV